jgi:hypothetical protein
MKKLIMPFILSVIFVILIINTALAAGTLTVSTERFIVVPVKSYYRAEIMAEVKNTGDAAIQFAGGVFEIYNPEGTVIGSMDLDGYCNPSVLEPGAVSFLLADITMKDVTDPNYIADYSLKVSGQDNITQAIERFPASTILETVTDPLSEYSYIITSKIVNSSDDIAFGCYYCYDIKDIEGNLLYMSGWYDFGPGLNPNNTQEVSQNMLSSYTSSCPYFDDEHIPYSADYIIFRFVAE